MTSASRTRNSQPTLIGLFAGIGGFELGLHTAGFRPSLFCEIDRAARAVLTRRFPGVCQHDDIRTLKRLPRADVVAAGFPCQDLSQAGRTAGIEGSQSSIIGELFELLKERRVPAVVLENVPFMLQLGKGRALEVIVKALEDLEYRWAYRIVDTLAFGLPQRRRRVFLVASLTGDPRDVLFADDEGEPEPTKNGVDFGFYWTEGTRGLGWAVDAIPTLKGGSTIGIPSPPAILLANGTIVKPDIRDAERLQGFRAGWTKPAEKVGRAGYRWKLVGNAVSVPVAKWLGKRLLSPGRFQPRTIPMPLPVGSPWPSAAWNVGEGRFHAEVSSWPVSTARRPLSEFLRFPPTLLSAKATAGFFSRARVSSLIKPDGFLEAVEAHLQAMAGEAPASRIIYDTATG